MKHPDLIPILKYAPTYYEKRTARKEIWGNMSIKIPSNRKWSSHTTILDTEVFFCFIKTSASFMTKVTTLSSHAAFFALSKVIVNVTTSVNLPTVMTGKS